MPVSRRPILGLGLCTCALSALGAFEPWLAPVGALLSAGVLIVQHRSAGAVIFRFAVDDWQRDGDHWALRIPPERHGRRNPTATVGTQTDLGFAEIWTGAEVADDGTVHVRIGLEEERHDCEVRIR